MIAVRIVGPSKCRGSTLLPYRFTVVIQINSSTVQFQASTIRVIVIMVFLVYLFTIDHSPSGEVDKWTRIYVFPRRFSLLAFIIANIAFFQSSRRFFETSFLNNSMNSWNDDEILQICVPWVCSRNTKLNSLIVTPLFEIIDLERRSLTSTSWDQNHVVLIPP